VKIDVPNQPAKSRDESRESRDEMRRIFKQVGAMAEKSSAID
jgi:hypothetical protein